MEQFVHLHVHSEYSLSEGIARIKPLVARAAELGMPALALTDLNNIYAAVKFYQAAVSQGVKPLIGAEVWVANATYPGEQDRFLLFAKNNSGYRDLCHLLSDAIIHHQHLGRPVLPFETLSQYAAHLVAIHHPRFGHLAHLIGKGELKEAGTSLAAYQAIFHQRLYLGIARLGGEREEEMLAQLCVISEVANLPLVAVNEVQFLSEADFDSHEIRVCINEGRQLGDPRRARSFTAQQYLKSVDEMTALFPDFPDALDNTVEIARRCNVFFGFGTNYLPHFPRAGGRSAEEIIRADAESGLASRLGVAQLRDDSGSAVVDQAYLDRLDMELGVINHMGFPGYFLIVADFIRWSKEQGIPVGPGRGSGAGSVVAWAMGITDLDPLEYGLLFERFLNPERVSMPDFDVDFCMEGRDQVIAYVAETYGRDQVSQIITFGSMAAKAVLRDVGRVLGHPYGYVDTIAKLVPFKPGITLEDAIQAEEELRKRYRDDEEAAQLIDEAKKLEGIARNVGKHAGGVVIAPSALTDFTALFAESETAQAVTQFDKDDLEAIGLVKFDFLGLRTLTIIDWAKDAVNLEKAAVNEPEIKVPEQAFNDKATFDLVKRAQTVAVFQLESSGMRDLVARLQPDCFEDLIALMALYRPGPLESGMVDDYVDRKHGRQSIKYPHPLLEKILEETYGVILYQEQVMQIAQVLANYSLGAADLLRRAMGKKKPEEMAKQRDGFVAGAGENGVSAEEAEYIFNLIEKFAGYGFNKSHSAAYALISFQTAWLKAHYPSAFMAATMSADMDHTDRIVSLLADTRSLGIEVLPPDVNQGYFRFKPLGADKILYGLGAVKGVGEAAIESVIAEREQGGVFTDLQDFCHRVDSQKVNRRTLESLIKSGSMDQLVTTEDEDDGERSRGRAQLMADLPHAMEVADQKNKAAAAGQGDMFGIAAERTQLPTRAAVQPWSPLRQLQEERQALGLYLSGHPYDSFRSELSGLGCSEVLEVSGKRRQVTVAGMCVAYRAKPTRTGGKIARVTLDDGRAQIEVSVFTQLLERARDAIGLDRILVVQGELEEDDRGYGPSLRANSLADIEMLREDVLTSVCLSVDKAALDARFLQGLRGLLAGYQGGQTHLDIRFQNAAGIAGVVQFGEAWRVRVDQVLVDALNAMPGVLDVQFDYPSQRMGEGLRYQAPPQRAARWSKRA